MTSRPRATRRDQGEPHARVPATGLGSPRNGLPARVDYEYRGTGRDERLSADEVADFVRLQMVRRRVCAAGQAPVPVVAAPAPLPVPEPAPKPNRPPRIRAPKAAAVVPPGPAARRRLPYPRRYRNFPCSSGPRRRVLSLRRGAGTADTSSPRRATSSPAAIAPGVCHDPLIP